MIDTLAPRPLGMTAFTLLVCVGGAALLAKALEHFRTLAPIVAVFFFAMVNGLLFLAIYGALRGPIAAGSPIAAVVPGALYDTALAAIAGPLAVAVIARRQDRDRSTW
jgi:hypothetical protein